MSIAVKVKNAQLRIDSIKTQTVELNSWLHSVSHAQVNNNVTQNQPKESKVWVAIKAVFLTQNGSYL